MATQGFKCKLTAILSAGVKGYSRLMGEDNGATVRTLVLQIINDKFEVIWPLDVATAGFVSPDK